MEHWFELPDELSQLEQVGLLVKMEEHLAE